MRVLLIIAFAAGLAGSAQAQQSTEDRIRDALRQSVTEMRAAQDQLAQAQSDLAKAQADKAALQTQLDAANAKLAEAASKPAAKPADEEALKAQLQAAEAQAAGLAQRSTKLQNDYQSAAAAARAKDDESRVAQAELKAKTASLEVCKGANTKLIDVAEQILNLYQSESFRALLLKSYEPVLGFARVKLQNTIQDYDDKIKDQEYVPPAPRR
jgi:chromosome segregation ATPase